MESHSLRGRRKKGRGRGRGEGEGEKLTLSPKPPSLFPFLPIPYPFRCLLRRLRVTCRIGVHTILAVQYSVDLQYSSQIVETGAFVLNFLQISYIHASHLCSHSNVPLSFPSVEPSVFWSTEMTANPNQHWGGKNHTNLSRFVTRIVALAFP